MATACLDAGLPIGRQDELVVLEVAAIPDSLIEVQDSSGFAGKLRVTRKNLGMITP